MNDFIDEGFQSISRCMVKLEVSYPKFEEKLEYLRLFAAQVKLKDSDEIDDLKLQVQTITQSALEVLDELKKVLKICQLIKEDLDAISGGLGVAFGVLSLLALAVIHRCHVNEWSDPRVVQAVSMATTMMSLLFNSRSLFVAAGNWLCWGFVCLGLTRIVYTSSWLKMAVIYGNGIICWKYSKIINHFTNYNSSLSNCQNSLRLQLEKMDAIVDGLNEVKGDVEGLERRSRAFKSILSKRSMTVIS